MSKHDWPIEVDETFGCWIFTGKTDENGRPFISTRNGPRWAHRFIYESEVGPIEDDKVLDHICRRPLCCNPKHLEPVTKAENERRKQWAVRVRKKTCPGGHDMGVNSIITPEGGRVCRECRGG